jgi:predicted Abi (CAAX) family protease
LDTFVRLRFRSIGLALRTWPDRRAWAWCGVIFLAYAAIAALVGLAAGFFHFGLPDSPVSKLILLPIALLVTPAIGEELVFRAIPLPHPSERRPRAYRLASAAIALIAFIAWHPLNGLWTPRVWPVFSDPVFLTLAALLGAACTRAYLASGSIWPAVLIHWVTVVVWGLLLGGRQLLDGGATFG